MIKTDELFSLDDITVIPAIKSSINSRSQIDLGESLPIFTALVDDLNWIMFRDQG